MQWILPVVVVVGVLANAQARSDIVCPEESLEDFDGFRIWQQFSAKNGDYLKREFDGFSAELKELIATYDAEDIRDLQSPVDPENLQDLIDGVWEVDRFAGSNKAMMMRMFTYGASAAISVVEAYCVSASDREPWDETIKSDRQARWCAMYFATHFCPEW